MANFAHNLESLLVNRFDSLNADCAVALLKIDLGHPHSTRIMDPHEMTVRRFLDRVLVQIVIVVVQLLIVV